MCKFQSQEFNNNNLNNMQKFGHGLCDCNNCTNVQDDSVDDVSNDKLNVSMQNDNVLYIDNTCSRWLVKFPIHLIVFPLLRVNYLVPRLTV